MSILKSGHLLFSIRRKRLVEALRRKGELEMLVMKYVRRTCDRGRIAVAGIVGGPALTGWFSVLVAVAGYVGDAVTGFSRSGEVWIARKVGCLPPPCWKMKIGNAGDLMAMAASGWELDLDKHTADFILLARLRVYSRKDAREIGNGQKEGGGQRNALDTCHQRKPS